MAVKELARLRILSIVCLKETKETMSTCESQHLGDRISVGPLGRRQDKTPWLDLRSAAQTINRPEKMRPEKSIETTDLSAYHEVTDLGVELSSEDLTAGCISLLSQVDWSKVAMDVIDKETPITRRAIIQRRLQNQIKAILVDGCKSITPERRRDGYPQEAAESINSDINTESGESDSDGESYERSFVETDDSEDGSAEYQDSDDSVEAGEEEDDTEDFFGICAVCRKNIGATGRP